MRGLWPCERKKLRDGEGEKNQEMESDEQWVSDYLDCGREHSPGLWERGIENMRGGEKKLRNCQE